MAKWVQFFGENVRQWTLLGAGKGDGWWVGGSWGKEHRFGGVLKNDHGSHGLEV